MAETNDWWHNTGQTMRCAYCNTTLSWTRENFPNRLYAECSACVAFRRGGGVDPDGGPLMVWITWEET